MRKSLFRASIVTALLSAIAVFVDWTAPFPLVPWGEGGYAINPWDERVFGIGLVLCVATIALGAFGRGLWRWLLMAAGLFFFAFSVMCFVQNHV
jgi:hypothetical protein